MPARKVTAIIGEPASGKSTLMREIMSQIGHMRFEKPKFLPKHRSDLKGISILGDYSDERQQFPGTDRMSMGVMPHILPYLQETTDAVLWEGARLCSAKLFETLFHSYDFRLYLLVASPAEYAQRRESERVQSERFLKSKQTQIQNIVKQFDRQVQYISGSAGFLPAVAEHIIQKRT